MPIDTIGMGELVGWSWLFPPFMWAFGAVAASPVETFEFDARTVRAWCAVDMALGYEVTRRVAKVLTKRLKSTRSRLIIVSMRPVGHAEERRPVLPPGRPTATTGPPSVISGRACAAGRRARSIHAAAAGLSCTAEPVITMAFCPGIRSRQRRQPRSAASWPTRWGQLEDRVPGQFGLDRVVGRVRGGVEIGPGDLDLCHVPAQYGHRLGRPGLGDRVPA